VKKIIHNEQDKADFIFYVKSKEVTSAHRVEFSKVRRSRSLSQNAYMWMCIACDSDYTGYDLMELYLYYLDRFPTFNEYDLFGEINSVKISSSKFNTLQMTIFIDNIRGEMARHGVQTPDADSQRAVDAYNYYKDQGKL